MRSLLLVAALCLCTTAQAQSPSESLEFDGARSEVYQTIGDVELKVWIFEPDQHQPTDSRPAIVFFFGGGWKSGTPRQFEQHCRYLASRGMVAMTADYRVRSRHGTLADSCVADAKSAVRWVRANAQRLGIDPNRIAAGGGSAGGHIAACTGVVPGFDGETEPKISSVPNAMALFNPALVLAPYEPFEDLVLDKTKLSELPERTGVDPKRISPIHHVASGQPPAIIFHGTADTTVSFATAAAFAKAYTAAGNRCELMAYPGAAHGFFNHGRGGKPGDAYLSTLRQLDAFLVSLGYLSGSDTLPKIEAADDPATENANLQLRGSLGFSRTTFEQTGHGRVAFIGGSITEMEGYRPLVMEWLQQRFPKTKFEVINAGISSTCSTTGAFRLQSDVLAHDPDLLFVEFAVNDNQDAFHPPQQCLRGMEGILRQARRHDPSLDIVVTHFVNPEMLASLQQGETPVSIEQHEIAAAHYQVSTVNVAAELKDRIERGQFSWEQYGGTHPKHPGNQLAAEMITSLLQQAWADSSGSSNGKAIERTLPAPIDPHSYDRGRFVPITAAKLGKGWQIERPQWSELPGQSRSRFEDQELLCSVTPGSELSLQFEGTAVGIYVLAGPDAGQLEYSIDDEPFRSVQLFHRYSEGLHYPRTVMLAAELPAAMHTLRVRVSDQQHPQSKGTAARILQFVVNASEAP